MVTDLGTAFNPMAPDQIDDPYPLYAQARRERPVFFAESLGAWVVTRYADIAAVARDTERFSSSGALESSTVFPDEVTGHPADRLSRIPVAGRERPARPHARAQRL